MMFQTIYYQHFSNLNRKFVKKLLKSKKIFPLIIFYTVLSKHFPLFMLKNKCLLGWYHCRWSKIPSWIFKHQFWNQRHWSHKKSWYLLSYSGMLITTLYHCCRAKKLLWFEMIKTVFELEFLELFACVWKPIATCRHYWDIFANGQVFVD